MQKMQTNKFLQIILFLFFVTISCKKNDLNQTLIERKQNNQVANTNLNVTFDDSFILSCGSGCAMRYIPEIITQHGQTINVKFKIETYINEELSETSYEKYNFIYNASGILDKILNERDNTDVLENLMPVAQEEFREFCKNLLKNKNVDVSKLSKSKQVSNSNNLKFITLPFDFENYYSTCIDEDSKDCEKKYPSYSYSENKDILKDFGVKDEPTSFFMLSKIKNLQPIILAFTDSDVEGYFLKVINNNKVISSLQIGKMDGENISDFIIKNNYEVEIYSRKDSNEKRVLEKKYKIQDDGLIK